MAGTTPGIMPTHRRTLRLVPNTTRTRRCHGVFIAGNELAVIYSNRRDTSAPGVLFELGNDVVEHSWNVTPSQARAMAAALVSAADAVDRHVIGVAAGNLARRTAAEAAGQLCEVNAAQAHIAGAQARGAA